jgi:hypothetical protein
MMKENPELSCSLHLNDAGTAIAELETCQGYQKYGTPGAQPTVDVVQSHLVLKSLSKVYTIAPNSSVLATVEVGKPIRLVVPIGEYGTLTLYLLASTWSGDAEGILTPAGEASTLSPPAPDDDEEVKPKRKIAPRKKKQQVVVVAAPMVQEEEIEEAVEPEPVIIKKKKRAVKKVVEPELDSEE